MTPPDDNPVSGAALDPALAEKALEMLRAEVRGNGIKTGNVTLQSVEGEVLSFTAHARFKILPKVNEERVNGREGGEVLGSEQRLRETLQVTLQQIPKDESVKTQTIAALKSRADLGFMRDALTVPLEALKHAYVVHMVCTTCSGKASFACTACQGKGMEICYKCHGAREMVCPSCSGARTVQQAGGQAPCPRCQGRGKVGCDICRQAGQLKCQACKGEGKMPCRVCGGKGWQSLVARLEVFTRGNFILPEDGLPDEARAMIESYGAALVTDGHAAVKIGDKIAAPLPGMAEDEFLVPYEVLLPWAQLTFALKKKVIEARLCGFKAVLDGLPPFTEMLIGRGIEALEKAAKGGGNVVAQVHDAARFRAIGETLLAAMRYPHGKSVEMLQQRYPHGLREETIERMVTAAERTLAQVTRRLRFSGLAGGLALAAVLYGAYFAAGLRGLLLPYLPGMVGQLAADGGIAVIGGLLVTLCIQIGAGSALKKALGKILTQGQKQRFLPRGGRTALWGYAGAAVIFFVMLQLGLMTGMAPPLWWGG